MKPFRLMVKKYSQLQDFFPGETNNNFQLRRLYDFNFLTVFFLRNQVRIAISACFGFQVGYTSLGSKIPTLKKGWSHLMKTPEPKIFWHLPLNRNFSFVFILFSSFHSFIIFFYGAGWCVHLWEIVSSLIFRTPGF